MLTMDDRSGILKRYNTPTPSPMDLFADFIFITQNQMIRSLMAHSVSEKGCQMGQHSNDF